MNFEHIIFSLTDGIASLKLNRPAQLNCFNKRMHEEMREALNSLQGNAEARVLLITGEGRGFCAGQDLGERNTGDANVPLDLGRSLDEYYNPLIRTLRELPMPVICAVNGVAAGAGANVALACDIVLAARSAVFIQAFCKIGLVPDCGGTWLLPRLVGLARAKSLALLGEAVSAEQAEQWGMIYRCVDDAVLQQEARRLAEHFARQATFGLALTKRALNAAFSNDFDQQLDLERDLQRLAGRTEDYREGVRAFAEKRPAEFKGR